MLFQTNKYYAIFFTILRVKINAVLTSGVLIFFRISLFIYSFTHSLILDWFGIKKILNKNEMFVQI